MRHPVTSIAPTPSPMMAAPSSVAVAMESLTQYNRDTGKRVRDFVGHTGDVWAIAVAPDNRTLVSGSADQTVRLWDIATGQNLLTVFVGADHEWVAWTPQGY